MELVDRFTKDFQNYGLTQESSLNLIGLMLSSARIKHQVPVQMAVDSEEYVKNLSEEQTKEYVIEMTEMREFLNSLSIEYALVKASVHILPRGHKIVLNCYGS